MVLDIASLQTADTGDYTCSASVTDSSGSEYVMDSEEVTNTVSITVSKYGEWGGLYHIAVVCMCASHASVCVQCEAPSYGHASFIAIPPTELNITVIPDYITALGEPPGGLAADRFTAGSVLSLTCMALGGSGDLTYSWSTQGNPPLPSGCGACALPISNTAILALGPPLYSYYAGTYTCTVSESGRPSSGNSDSYTVTVVGECHGVCTCVCSVL